MRASAIAVVGMLVIVASGAGDVTESSEYVSLQTENALLVRASQVCPTVAGMRGLA